MKVSKKARYALQALVDLTTNMKENPIPLAEIAGRQEMSFSYLEQVFHELKKAGVVKSMKLPERRIYAGKAGRSDDSRRNI